MIPLQHKNEFKLTAEELEAAITPKTKILVMPFPNNPTGSIMTKEDLELYMRAAKEADFEKGQKFESFANGEEEVRVCALDGKTLDDMFEPGFAALVITKDK